MFDDQEPEGTHHYIVTLQKVTPGGALVSTNSGAYTPPAGGESRYASYRSILRHVYNELPEMGPSAAVLFFSLEPNFVKRTNE